MSRYLQEFNAKQFYAFGPEMRPGPGKFECIGQGRSAWCKKAELSCTLIRNTKEAPPWNLCITSDWMSTRGRSARKNVPRMLGLPPPLHPGPFGPLPRSRPRRECRRGCKGCPLQWAPPCLPASARRDPTQSARPAPRHLQACPLVHREIFAGAGCRSVHSAGRQMPRLPREIRPR